jgi:ubiquinone/menaquinone biosynthesis C-methylase UbiE
MAKIETYRQRYRNPGKAERYAKRFERGEHKRQDQREQKAVREIFAALPDCRSVLDVPSGAGRFLKTLAEEGRQVIEADVAFEMLEYARGQSMRKGITAQFLQVDASRLPLTDGAVDAVFCNRLLHHILEVSQRAQFLREFHRVSRRYLVISFFDYRALGAVRRALKRLKGAKPMDERQPSLEKFTQELTATGWKLSLRVPTGPFWVSQKYLVLEKA